MDLEPVTLTQEELRTLQSLAQIAKEGEGEWQQVEGSLVEIDLEDQMRKIARQEIASMAGLVLSRSDEATLTRSIERNMADEAVREVLARVFGEVLSDFSGHTGSGDDPGD